MRLFRTAVQLLTFAPQPEKGVLTEREIGRSTPFFPVVGLCLGLVLVFLNRLLGPYLESEILGVVLVSFLILLTGARHLEGLRLTIDRLCSRSRAGNGGASRVPLSGILAVVVVIMLKFRAVEVMGELRDQGLLVAAVLARWSIVILAYGSSPEEGESSGLTAGYVRAWQLLWATVLALAITIFVGGNLALWSALWVSLLTLVAGSYLRRRLAGEATDACGAVAEISEALVMVLFASL